MSQSNMAAQQPYCTPEAIARRVSEQAFGRPLITNVLRGHVAEAIVAAALEPDWRWCAADYASWDFEHANGLRLEVKQSAERQSWAQRPQAREVASFDIASRTGRYEKDADQQDIWIDQPGRAADIYVLAHHDVMDDSADHRDPAQWRFYVLAATALPDWKRLGIANVRRLASAVEFAELSAAVALVAAGLSRQEAA